MHEEVSPVEVARLLRLLHSGKHIVFVRGSFDVLHYGHFRLLESCQKLGDFVVVGLNDDETVRNIKGTGRPVHIFRQRQEMLESLKMVSVVLPVAMKNLIEIISALRPDVIVEGGSHPHESVAGFRESKKWDADIRVVPLEGGLSTSRILQWHQPVF